jgi:hypothetical protein
VGSALVFALTAGAQTAAAEGNGVLQRTDPKAGSPAGVIYQIPLDSGRRDAAPVLPVGSQGKGPGAGAAGGGSGPGGGSGGGSAPSAQPASASGGGAGGASGGSASGGTPSRAQAAAEGGGTPSNPSSIHSENGFGSSSQVPGLSKAALRTGAGVAAASTAGSTLPTYLLIALVAAAAVVAGVLSAKSRRRRREGEGEHPARP